MACQTTKNENVTDTEYIYPVLNFPAFPVPDGKIIPLDAEGKVVRDDETEIETVNMPFWYFCLVFDTYRYKIKTTEIEYNAFVEKVK